MVLWVTVDIEFYTYSSVGYGYTAEYIELLSLL